MMSLTPAVSAQGYGPAAPEPTATTEVGATAVTVPSDTTAVSVLGAQQTTPEVAGPEVGSNQLPVTGSTVFPLVAGGIGLVALGLMFRQADRAGDKDKL